MNPETQTPTRRVVGPILAAAFVALAFASVMTVSPAAAHYCRGDVKSDCGGCSSGNHDHAWSNPYGSCYSSCLDPLGLTCQPGTPTTVTVYVKKLVSGVTINGLAACDGESQFNYYDGAWINVANQQGRSYSTKSTSGLNSAVSFYQLSGTSCIKLQPRNNLVPAGTNYILLEAVSGEGTASFYSFQ